ncbi:hypothetical protein QTP70_006214 [Hemibagrus guttatus]|uniref:FYVE-type domain-containing protein n=1 Tax=Hemibagrus guttatus TaxID=175788 RepID=A0AAE0QUA9_9TELE|nr:hypothetical protein QTP70_006214 [Hemibagrus guttatus]
MRQAVSATLSVWGERRLGYTTLNDSREALLEDSCLMPGLKEDSVVEEKELADGEQDEQEAVVGSSPSTPPALAQGDGAAPENLEENTLSPALRSELNSGRRGSVNITAPENGSTTVRRGSLGALLVQRCSSLGSTAPQWVPDSQAPVCMKCGSRFSFTKRRHHCRACGKVFCVVCCDLRFRLTHLGGKEGRVCVTCHATLINNYTVEEKRTETSLLEELEQGQTEPLVFVLNANLLAMVKIVSYVNRRCWCVTSKGMHAVGQPEVVVLLQCLPEEKRFPTDIFNHFIQIYWDAQTAGKLLNHLSHSLAARGFLDSEEHAGFLYVRPTLQSLDGLPLPPQPFLFGLLILRAESPWARAFPLRLMLRLGAEYRFYPCPLFSVRFREPLFGQINNSIMRLLVDFRFYRYTLPVVTGLMVDLEARSTCITIPKSRHAELLKVLSKSNEKLLAMGACFNERADSHLICVQTADGQYQTQAISIHSQPRRNGLLVQVTMETMLELRRALRDMRDFTLTCGKLHQSDRQEYVHIRWQDEEPRFNKGIISPIDGKSMESITCIKAHQRLEYRANGKVIRWTEVFFLQREEPYNGPNSYAHHNRLTERLARAFCLALCNSLSLLKEDSMTKLALRVTLDGQKMEFLAGSNGQPLPLHYQDTLNQSLSAVVQSVCQRHGHTALQLELIFYILEDIA